MAKVGKSDRIIDYVVRKATLAPEIEWVKLFGSRARGDFHEKSDYDLAFYCPKWSHAKWSEWSESLKGDAPTLYALDLVKIEEGMSKDLRNAIDREGVIVYART